MKGAALLVAVLLVGCCSDNAAYRRGWNDGFDEAERYIEISEHVVEMRKQLRGK